MVEKLLGVELDLPTTTITFADGSQNLPYRKNENVLIWVDKQQLLVLDVKEGNEFPLILSRLFLTTSRAMIDVWVGKLMIRSKPIMKNVTPQIFHNIFLWYKSLVTILSDFVCTCMLHIIVTMCKLIRIVCIFYFNYF
jgi:hypothetical protein